MSDDDKLVIDRHALRSITDAALAEFKGPIPRDLDSADLRKYLLFKGLESYLISKGIEPCFIINIPRPGERNGK